MQYPAALEVESPRRPEGEPNQRGKKRKEKKTPITRVDDAASQGQKVKRQPRQAPIGAERMPFLDSGWVQQGKERSEP